MYICYYMILGVVEIVWPYIFGMEELNRTQGWGHEVSWDSMIVLHFGVG